MGFRKESFPKIVDIQMNFSKFNCFDAEYEVLLRRITILKGNHLSFVKYRVKSRFGMDNNVESDKIKLFVGDQGIETEEDMQKYLLHDDRVNLCTVIVLILLMYHGPETGGYDCGHQEGSRHIVSSL